MAHANPQNMVFDEEIEVVPGTVHLIDQEGTMHSKHAEGAEHDIVLVPAPSSHPDDPLNWTRRRKYLSAFCMSVYVLVTGICSSALYSTLGPLSKATGLSYGDLNSGTGYMALGVQYGKRPVYLICLAGTLGVMVWQPHVRSNGEWIATKILQGIFGAPMESLAEITVSDVFFTHERGRHMALYALALGYSNGIAPLIMGFINDGQGYQWVFYWCAIFSGVAFLIIFFFMEETNFDRRKYQNLEQAAGGEPVKNISANHDESPSNPESSDGHQAGDAKEENIPDKPLAVCVSHRSEQSTPFDQNLRTKSYAARLKPIESHGFKTKNHVLRLMGRPILLLTFPVIAYAGFLYGCNIVWLSVLNATESMVLSNPPYSMSTSIVGLTFIAPLIGTTLACAYTGLFGDRFIIKMARRNKGVMEAEHRLWLFMPSLILISFGCILWGVGAQHHIHWFGLVFAMGVISFITTAGSQISIAYCIDCYRDLGSEALASVIVVRNTMSFGIGYGVTPWVVNMGYQNAFILGAFAGLAHNLTIFPIIRWGRNLRQRSSNRYWGYVRSGADLAVNH
ncbi:hypothetical protein VTK73DRAFT_8073 [Phialemonium thermophilum]|uniref:Major facilitator superfamily (MFS) profile domain-containing protein n=1 Tax=Phialemonium thermophilum TaxID=223376 RepID=A0ABR3XRG3_9PEZI